MRALAHELGDHCAWLVVYVAEAHATDEWPISSARFNGSQAQTRTTRARADAARAFARDFELEGLGALAVDAPEEGEPFDAAFAPWPVRFYVLQHNAATQGAAVRFVSNPHDEGFIELAAFRRALLHAAAAEI